jgi:hypothetical protein
MLSMIGRVTCERRESTNHSNLCCQNAVIMLSICCQYVVNMFHMELGKAIGRVTCERRESTTPLRPGVTVFVLESNGYGVRE